MGCFNGNKAQSDNISKGRKKYSYQGNYEDSEARELLKKTYGNDDYDCRDIMVLLRRP